LRSKIALQLLLSSACFRLRQLSISAASGMALLHNLNVSEAHAALCQGATRFSSAKAVAAQPITATITRGRLNISIISNYSSGAFALRTHRAKQEAGFVNDKFTKG
jgi:hypothetical protein